MPSRTRCPSATSGSLRLRARSRWIRIVIAMDEPAAGLNPKEVEELDRADHPHQPRGIAVLLVEHHMDLVMGISSRITVLDHGEKLAEGAPVRDPGQSARVQAYLGGEEIEEPARTSSCSPIRRGSCSKFAICASDTARSKRCGAPA